VGEVATIRAVTLAIGTSALPQMLSARIGCRALVSEKLGRCVVKLQESAQGEASSKPKNARVRTARLSP